MTKDALLMVLPPYTGTEELINGRQRLVDIVEEVLDAHEYFAGDYDFIAAQFIDRTTEGTCRQLFSFLKLNVAYVEETEDAQYTKSPAALLETGESDCKMYASFIGGVLDAMCRAGAEIDWCYAFAKYPQGTNHVFIIVEEAGREIWVDPVLSEFNIREPHPSTISKKRIGMALIRLSGTGKNDGQLGCSDRERSSISGASVGDWIKANPGLTLGIAAALVLLLMPSKKRRRA
jgi:hypothetical protein